MRKAPRGHLDSAAAQLAPGGSLLPPGQAPTQMTRGLRCENRERERSKLEKTESDGADSIGMGWDCVTS